MLILYSFENNNDLQFGSNHLVMKPEITKTDQKNWALPGEPISIEEFEMGIKEAEVGPFMSLEELKRSVEEWKKEQNL